MKCIEKALDLLENNIIIFESERIVNGIDETDRKVLAEARTELAQLREMIDLISEHPSLKRITKEGLKDIVFQQLGGE